MTELHTAVFLEAIDEVRRLLGTPRGIASINTPSVYGNTPLHTAAKQEGGANIVKLLLAHGAKVDQENCKSYTPLDYAKRHKHTDIQELFRKWHPNR